MRNRTRVVITVAALAFVAGPLTTARAQHLADSAAAKLANGCQKAMLQAGPSFAAKKLSRLDKCVDGILACVQTKPANDPCRGKTADKCVKAFAGIAGDEAKLVAAIQRKCGDVASADLFDPAGIDENQLVGPCAGFQTTLADIGDVATCVARQHECRVDELFDVEEPRSRELLSTVGVSLAPSTCLVDRGGTGAAAGTPDVGKNVDSCAAAIKKAARKLATARLKSLSKCVQTAFSCVQLKQEDPACFTKATTTCSKLRTSIDKATAKLAPAVDKRCAATVVPFATIADAAGLNLDALATECAAFGVPALTTIADYETCVVAQHSCHAEELLRFQAPRAAALLASAGQGFSTSCPTPTATPGPTATDTVTPSPTDSPTPSDTPTETASETPTESPTPTVTASETETPTPTVTESATPTITESPTPTETATLTATPTETATDTPTPTETVTPTETPTETETPTPTETETPTETPTPTETETPTPTPTATPHDYTALALACYDFESGSFTASSCGSGNTLTNNGATADTVEFQSGSQSAAFDSTMEQYLSCTTGNCPGIDLTGPTQQISITCWARRKAPTDGNFAGIFSHETDTDGGWAFFKTAGDTFSAGLLPDGDCSQTGTYVTVEPSDVLADDTWYHLAMTSDNTTLKAFVNAGIPASTPYSSGICGSAAEITIGAKADTPAKDFFDGDLDECAIFDFGLTDQQVCDICRFGLDGTHADRGALCNDCTGS